MIPTEEIAALERYVPLLGLAIGLALGWISRYARFCTMGAIADWYASGDTARLRMWLLAIATAIVGTQALIATNAIEIKDSFYIAPRLLWLSNIVGGLTFGFGMVLASGCGSRTLVRIGGGSLKALVVFLVMAIIAFMTMRGILGVLRVNTIEKIGVTLNSKQDLASLIGLDPVLIASIATASLLVFIFTNKSFLRQPRLIAGGLVIGLLVVAGWFTTGNIGFVLEDPNTLEPRFVGTNTRGIESLTFVAPLAYALDLLMFWSDRARAVTFGIAAVSGVALGAFIHAIASREFRLEGFQNRQDLSRHLVGAALMGFGGVVAFGCTIGQGITGLSLLALGSLLATLSIVAGAWLGLRWIERGA
ncbi:YeeE/YedE family protein [beta proteobacterium MWH-UniP1]